jgi:predicted DNA-binding transcriptional regulator AlpA
MNNPVTIGNATLYNADCMELMAQYPDIIFKSAYAAAKKTGIALSTIYRAIKKNKN